MDNEAKRLAEAIPGGDILVATLLAARDRGVAGAAAAFDAAASADTHSGATAEVYRWLKPMVGTLGLSGLVRLSLEDGEWWDSVKADAPASLLRLAELGEAILSEDEAASAWKWAKKQRGWNDGPPPIVWLGSAQPPRGRGNPNWKPPAGGSRRLVLKTTVNAQEKQAIEENARRAGVSTSKWLRSQGISPS